MKIAVVGAGKLGASLTAAFLSAGHEITLIEKDEKVAARAKNRFDCQVIAADAKEMALLKEIQIQNYDLLVSCSDEDEKNIFVSAMAKTLGCPKVVARVRAPEHVDQLQEIKKIFNIDEIVNPDYACAAEIYRSLTEKYSLQGGRFKLGGVEILEFPVEKIEGLTDMALKDCRDCLGDMLIAAISRAGRIIIPNGNTVLKAEDKIYVVCHKEKAEELRRKVRDNSKASKLRKVMIAGGGKTGFFLAEQLSNAGVAVKIIEADKSRCEYLSDRLHNTLVLHGRASDKELLREENLDQMDAFIAVTGMDEDNLLLSLMANSHGIPDVVAKISHDDFEELTDTLGVSMTINPVDMCTASILKYISQNSSLQFSKMIQGQAEFIEAHVSDDMPVAGKTLTEIDIPEGVLLAAITRDKELLIPNGSTEIKPGDKLVVISMLSAEASLEELFNKDAIHKM